MTSPKHNISEASLNSSSNLSSKAIECYLTEYRECMESYRHTYATIWQSGIVFTTISVAIVAFVNISDIGGGSHRILHLVQVLVPIPILFWWWGVFRSMNRYGELRRKRLEEIEKLLSESIPRLQMCHFRNYNRNLPKEGTVKRIRKFKWLLKPRVSEVVSTFGVLLLLLELYLLWAYYLSHWLMKLLC